MRGSGTVLKLHTNEAGEGLPPLAALTPASTRASTCASNGSRSVGVKVSVLVKILNVPATARSVPPARRLNAFCADSAFTG